MDTMQVARDLMGRARTAKEACFAINITPMDMPPQLAVRFSDGTMHAGQVTEEWDDNGPDLPAGEMISVAIRALWNDRKRPTITEIQFVAEGYQVGGDDVEDLANVSLNDAFVLGDKRVKEGISVYVARPDDWGGVDVWVVNQTFHYDGWVLVWDDYYEIEPSDLPPEGAGQLMDSLHRLITDTEGAGDG